MEIKNATQKIQPLSLFTKISYGCGDLASQFVWSFIGSYLMFFYTDVALLPATAISAIFFATRLLDAVDDPIMGAIAERTKSKHGRFRPYLLYGAPVLIIAYILCFTAPSFSGNMTFKIVYAAITYIALSSLYSLVNLPYGALMTVMSKDTNERSELSMYRMLGSNIGGLILNAIALPLILFFGQGDRSKPFGYTMTAILLSIIALPLFWLVFARCKEVITVKKNTKKVPVKDSFKSLLNRPFISLLFFNTLALIGKFGQSAVSIYFYVYVLERQDLVAILMMLLSGMTAIGIFFFSRLSGIIGKKKTTFLSFLLSGIFQMSIFFIDRHNIALIVLLTILLGLSQFGLPVANSMLADVVDYTEDRTGVRPDGTGYSVFSFGTKLASTLVGTFGVILLSQVGYVPNITQTSSVVIGISAIVNLIPGFCWLLSLIPLSLYNISEKSYLEIRHRLDSEE